MWRLVVDGLMLYYSFTSWVLLKFIFGQQGTMFSKGKGLLGMSSRPRRRSCKVSLNYDDNHLWEDCAFFVGEKLRIHTMRWQDPHVLQEWGMEEDFNSFATATGLLAFAQTHRRHMRSSHESSSLPSDSKGPRLTSTRIKVRHLLPLLFANLVWRESVLLCL